MIIWFTGLSSSGKTTISDALKKKIERAGSSVFQVDGDIFRKEQKSRNEFSREEIVENNHRIISYCRSIEDKYDFIIVSVISPFEETRKKAREVFRDRYMEIFVNCPLDVLIKRDVKGLYAKAIRGEIDNLIGFSKKVPYETPQNPELIIYTDRYDIDSSVNMIVSVLKDRFGLNINLS